MSENTIEEETVYTISDESNIVVNKSDNTEGSIPNEVYVPSQELIKSTQIPQVRRAPLVLPVFTRNIPKVTCVNNVYKSKDAQFTVSEVLKILEDIVKTYPTALNSPIFHIELDALVRSKTIEITGEGIVIYN